LQANVSQKASTTKLAVARYESVGLSLTYFEKPALSRDCFWPYAAIGEKFASVDSGHFFCYRYRSTQPAALQGD